VKWLRFLFLLVVFALPFLRATLFPFQTQAAFLHNDRYAWFAEDADAINNPFCQAFQQLDGFDLKGVNIYDLAAHSPADLAEEMAYLESCGVNAIRAFGMDNAAEVSNLVSIIQTYPQFKYVIAISNPVMGEGATSGLYSGRGSWFANDPEGYEAWARSVVSGLQAVKGSIAIIELANEPHCGGDGGCVEPFNAWVIRMSGIASALSVPVSFGGGFLDSGAAESTNNLATLQGALSNSLTSFHVYPDEDSKAGQLSAAISALGAGNIYIGELGFACEGSNCKVSSNDTERAQKFIDAAQGYKAMGINKIFLWVYSGFGAAGNENNPPPFVMPDADPNEVRKYLANSQVYCAPNQAFEPDIQGERPDLSVCVEHRNVAEQENQLGGYPLAARISLNDRVCNNAEYPLIDATETWDVTRLSFPLFRNDAGGISIEADLSRVDPTSTFAEAAKENSRPDYAPQFYLTSPEMQCQNAVNHLQYVQKICQAYTASGDATECPLNAEVEFGDGSVRTMMSLRGVLPDEAACANISADMADPTNIRGQAIRAIATQTPKQFKLAFFVQHTYMHEPPGDGNKGPVLRNWLGIEALSTWFQRGSPIDQTLFPGEVVDVIPVWYNSGLALSAYDEYLDESGNVKPYNYDPDTLPRETDPSTLEPNDKNFVSGWNQTYATVLPMHIQQRINAEIRNTVADTWAIMKEWLGKVGMQGPVEVDGFTIEEPIIECYDRQCLCYGDSTAEELGRIGVGGEYAAMVAQNCPALTMPEVASALPEPFSVPNTPAGRDFMYQFKEAIIERINSGVQISEPFDPSKEAPADYRGPLGERSFERCAVEPEDYGIQESAQAIVSGANQRLVPNEVTTGEPTPEEPAATGFLSGPRQSITNLAREFVAKILPGAQIEQQFLEKKTSRAYLILPDEALTIEKTQSYVAPMFFSPEMYASIMTGMNPIYPFAMGGAISEDLSAFLRTQGLSYTVDSEPDGYGIYQATINYYDRSSSGCTIDLATGTQSCGCVPVPSERESETRYLGRPVDGTVTLEDLQEPVTWIEKGAYVGSGPATCSRLYEIDVMEVQQSTVDLDKQPRENANPETPGQLAAINEFLRRMAFLPIHMVQEYTGLEKFYQGSGTLPTAPTGPDDIPPSSAILAQCAYTNGTPTDISMIRGEENLMDYACQATQGTGIPAGILRAILDSEGSPLVRAVRNGESSYNCQVNSLGAVGPMQVIIGQCSTASITDCTAEQAAECAAGGRCACLGGVYNRVSPDMCSIQGGFAAAVDTLKNKKLQALAVRPDLVPNSRDHMAKMVERYYSEGQCGDLRDPYDGPSSGDGLLDEFSRQYDQPGTFDYCGYIMYAWDNLYNRSCN